MARLTSVEYAKKHGAKAGRELARERSGKSTSSSGFFSKPLADFSKAIQAPQRLSRTPQVRREAAQNYRIRQTYLTAPPGGPYKITRPNLVKWALANPNRSESRIIVDAAGGLKSAKNSLLSDDMGSGGIWKDAGDVWNKVVDSVAGGKGVGSDALKTVGQASRGVGKGLEKTADVYEKAAVANKRSKVRQAGGIGELGNFAVPFALETASQFAKSPKATIKDVGTLPEAIIGGTGQVGYDTVKGVIKGDYLAGPKKFGKALGEDYSTRYKSLAAGNYGQYRKELQKRESVFPEFLDASMFTGGAAAGGGRIIGSAARAGRLGPTLEKIAAEPRPLLRTAGGVTKTQKVSPNIFRAAGQRLEDVRRKRQYEKLADKAIKKGNGIEGLVPNEGEVVPLRNPLGIRVPGINNQRRLGNKEGGRVLSQARVRGDIGKEYVTNLVRKIETDLSGPEQRAFGFATQGLLPLNEARTGFDIGKSVEMLTRYRSRFEQERSAALAEAKKIEEEGGPEATTKLVGAAPNLIKGLQEKIDSIQAIDAILADPEKALTPNLYARSKEAADLSRNHHAGVNEGTAARRRARPQAELAFPAMRPTMREAASEMPYRGVVVDRFDSRASLKSVERQQRKQARQTGVVPQIDTSRIADGLRDYGMDVRNETPAETLRRAKRSIGTTFKPITDQAEVVRSEIAQLESDLASAEKAAKETDKHPDVKHAQRMLRIAELDREKLRGEVKKSKRGEPNYKREPNAFDRLARADQRVKDAREALKAARESASADAKGRVQDLRGQLVAKQDDILENEQRYYQEFADEVAKEAERLGFLPNPAYFKHFGLERTNFSMYTTGPGIRYFDDLARSNMTLLKMGLYDLTPQAFEMGLMTSFKRAMLIYAITDNIKTLGLHILNNKPVPKDLTLRELQTWLAGEKVNIDDYYFINPKKAMSDDVLGSGDSPFFVDPKEMLAGKENRQVAGLGPEVQAMTQMSPAAFADVKGWVAIPREAGGAALEQEAKGSGLIGRGWDKVRAFGSWGVLATSIPWFTFQRVVDLYALTAGNKFNPLKVARTLINYPLVWHSLTPQMQEAIKIEVGSGMHRRTARMGKTVADLSNRSTSAQWLIHTWDKLSKTKVIRGAKAAPFVLFQMDNWFTSHVKQAQFITKAEEIAAKERYNALRGSMSEANLALDKAIRLLRKPSADQIENAMRNAQVFEDAADHVLRVFGDWDNLSGLERHGLARVPMFYTWIRFATRTMFHTLPVRHPLILMMLLKMAQIHKQDLEEHYGTKELDPWSYGNVITESGNKIGLSRISPVSALGLDMAQMFMSLLTQGEIGKGPRALISVLPPPVTAAFEAFTGQKALTGADLKIGAKTSNDKEPFKNGGLPAVIRTWAASFAQSNPLYAALLMQLAGDDPISDDSLPGAITKRKYTTPAKQEEAKKKNAAKGSPTRRAIQRAVVGPLPMPDNTKAILEAKHKASGKAKKKKKSGDWDWGDSSGSSKKDDWDYGDKSSGTGGSPKSTTDNWSY